LLKVAVGGRGPDGEDGVGISARGDGDDECEVGNAGDPEFQIQAPRREKVGAQIYKKDDEVELPGADG
jgi:hypothetical protein